MRRIARPLAAVCAGLALAGSLAAPVTALAEDNSQSSVTEVTIVSATNDGEGKTQQDENLRWSVPTQIAFAAKADGTLVGPDATSTQIKNLSAFPIHVKGFEAEQVNPFNLVSDVTKGDAANAFQFSMSADGGTTKVDAATGSADLGSEWNMGYQGGGTDTLSVTTSDGRIARVNADLSQAQRAATITWTVASGQKASK